MPTKPLRYNKRGLIGESGHKRWDAHVNYVGRGNVCANGFTSSYIRPFHETECNGKTFPLGHLQKSDLKLFRENFKIPKSIEDTIRDSKESLILACAHHPKAGRRIVHGWILTTPKHRLVQTEKTGPTPKSDAVIDWVTSIIAEPETIPVSTSKNR